MYFTLAYILWYGNTCSYTTVYMYVHIELISYLKIRVEFAVCKD